MRDLLSRIGSVTRAIGSKGPDLTLWRNFQRWTVSCKARKDGLKFVYDELEKADIVAFKCDRKIPVFMMLGPKFCELAGKAEAEDAFKTFGDVS
jgi:hypothetical protein